MISDPKKWFHGKKNVLFVHAHPDDETIATGGVLAALSENGLNPSVLTLTRGEQGEIRPEAQAEFKSAGSLAALRLQERAKALEVLGVFEHELLGQGSARVASAKDVVYQDSGMEWGPDGLAVPSSASPAEALTKWPAVDLINDVMAYAVHVEAEAVVSYDEIGGYGHPDHILSHQLAKAIAYGLEIDFWQIEHDCEDTDAETYDVSEWQATKFLALRPYASQLKVVDEKTIEHVGGQVHEIPLFECYKKVL